MKKNQLTKLGNIELDEDNILFGVTKDGDTGLNLMISADVTDGRQAQYLQENIGIMLGQLASKDDSIFHIIGKAFAEAVSIKTEDPEQRRHNIMVEIQNETPGKKEPEFKVRIDNKIKS